MAAFLKKTEKSADFAKGGNTHMFGPQKAGEQDAATTAHDVTDGSDKYACGGKGKMFGYSGSQTARAGITSAR